MGKTKRQRENEAIAKRASQINKDRKVRTKAQAGVDSAGVGAISTAVENDKAAVKRTSEHIATTKTVSRAELMAKAKAQGIKYYRILTKAELFSVLDHPGDIVSITEKAQARWKAGWGSRKKDASPEKEQ